MTNMNAANGVLAICYLAKRDGRCCTTKFGYGCGKTFSQLIAEAKENDEQTGRIRKLRIIEVDRIDNTKNHHIDIYNETLMFEYELLCRSCNRKKNPHKPKTNQSSGRPPTREKLDNLRYEPTFHRNLKTFLQDNQQGCFVEIIMNSKNFSGGCSQVAGKRYFTNEEITAVNKRGIYQKFPFQCNSENCNGVHTCLVGIKPQKLITNEHSKLAAKWLDEYGSKKDVWKQQASLSMKHYMDLDEYLETHGILIVHEFL